MRLSTVLHPAGSHDLVDLATIKDDLQITDTASDAFLARAIARASAAVASFCGRVFVVETVRDLIYLERGRAGPSLLQLSRWPVNSLASLSEDGAVLVEGLDFALDAAAGQLMRLGGDDAQPSRWPALPVTAIYDAGFATIPWDVEDAVARMVKAQWEGRGRDPFLRSQDVGGAKTEYWVPKGPEAAMSPDIADLLDKYRVPVVA